MPELPEVETVRRQVEPLVRGRRIERAVVSWSRIIRPPGGAAFTRRIRGRRFEGVRRHGKFLFFDLDEGEVLLSHLGMTGGYRMLAPGDERPAHAVVRFALDDGREFAYIDPRRFGRMRLARRDALPALPELRGIGPDPLQPGFSAGRLAEILAATRRMVRELLLDQRRIAGLGNIYVAEALFRAGIDPRAPACSLGPDAAARLHAEIRGILERAIRWNGSTILSYRDSEGNPGGFASQLAVYGREGEPCRRCGSPVRREVRSGRSSFFCPRCQRPARSGTRRRPA